MKAHNANIPRIQALTQNTDFQFIVSGSERNDIPFLN